MEIERHPGLSDRSGMTASAYCSDGNCSVGRTYLCVSCYQRAIICSQCDRGQIYCSRDCASRVRHSRLREAGRRYQATDRGRRLHAERSRRYRERNQHVTHQGSAPEATAREIIVTDVVLAVPSSKQTRSAGNKVHYCHFCGCSASEFVRQRFLRPIRGARGARRCRGDQARSGL